MQRLEHNLTLFDIVRLDHFIGFVSYWQVPTGRKTAAKGKWVKGPGQDFFNKLFKRVSPRNVIVEDLGRVTADVRKIIEKFSLRTMKVLQFAFDEGSSGHCHRLYNHTKNSIVYTGTHDNNTIRGWFEKEANQRQKQILFRYLGRKVTADQIHWELIRLTIGSVADLAIVPMQDILGLGQLARMNRPGTVGDNWAWRLRPGQFTKPLITKLAQLTQTHGRGFV
jgi:4-alpha-glucanotransferase